MVPQVARVTGEQRTEVWLADQQATEVWLAGGKVDVQRVWLMAGRQSGSRSARETMVQWAGMEETVVLWAGMVE